MNAKVWNDNDKEYREKFKGETIVIPPKGFVVMEAMEANTFRGTFTTILRDGTGRDLNPKKIRVEVLHDEVTAVPQVPVQYICQKDGSLWPSQEALDRHIAQNWSDSLIDETAKDQIKKKQQGR